MNRLSRFLLLVGPRGSGKTTLGHALARVLDVPVYDTDRMVEESAGEPLARLWEREGETAFRRFESRALDCLSRLPPGVVSTGGGIVLSPENRAALRRLGFVLYLHVPEEQLVARLSASSDRRPRLREGIPLADEIRQVSAERDPLYREVADHTLPSGALSIALTVEEIFSVLRRVSPPIGVVA